MRAGTSGKGGAATVGKENVHFPSEAPCGKDSAKFVHGHALQIGESPAPILLHPKGLACGGWMARVRQRGGQVDDFVWAGGMGAWGKEGVWIQETPQHLVCRKRR